MSIGKWSRSAEDERSAWLTGASLLQGTRGETSALIGQYRFRVVAIRATLNFFHRRGIAFFDQAI
jgi:hypothetical protein